MSTLTKVNAIDRNPHESPTALVASGNHRLSNPSPRFRSSSGLAEPSDLVKLEEALGSLGDRFLIRKREKSNV